MVPWPLPQATTARYGFSGDHIADRIGALDLMGGLALSGYKHSYVAMGLLVGFLVLSIQSRLAAFTAGEFRFSF